MLCPGQILHILYLLPLYCTAVGPVQAATWQSIYTSLLGYSWHNSCSHPCLSLFVDCHVSLVLSFLGESSDICSLCPFDDRSCSTFGEYSTCWIHSHCMPGKWSRPGTGHFSLGRLWFAHVYAPTRVPSMPPQHPLHSHPSSRGTWSQCYLLKVWTASMYLVYFVL